ncbi:MAG: hypothetical protein ABIQ11_09865 [Saprospiraceae bacterium]
MYRFILFSLLTILVTFSCKRSANVTVTETQDTLAVRQDTEVVLVPSLTKAWETDTTFKTPESVLYDPVTNLLYVSNIGGVPPIKKDGDGFISQVGLDGKVINLRWAKGFDAPKGMSLVGNTLYVTDIDRIKAVDTKTGKTTNTWKVAGSSFLNDIAVSTDSIIYITDSDKRTIHMLQNGKVTSVYSDTTVGGINGIYVDGNTLMLAGYESGNVYTMNIGDKSVHKVASGIPNGDGIERYRNGWLVSNWGGEVYYIDDKGRVTEVLDTQEAKLNSADIEVIEDKDLIIIPTFFGNRVTAYTLKIGV